MSAGFRGGRVRPTALTWFLCVLAVVIAAYTVLALDMEWRAATGRLGPGFFPRVIGVLGVVLCGVAAVRSLRPAPAEEAAEPAPAEEAAERHPWTIAAIVAGMAGFLLLLIPLGAALVSWLFMFAVLELLGRGHLVRHAAVSALIAVSLYLVLEGLLDAGLPEGLLPLP